MAVVDPTTSDGSETPDVTINAVEAMGDPEPLPAPVITLKQKGTAIDSGTEVSNGSADVTFELSNDSTVSAANAALYYSVDGTDPVVDENKKYTTAVTVTAPPETTEKTVTIKAITYIPASGTAGQEGYVAAQTSAVATATVVFKAKGKTVSLSEESETATIKIGETTLAADTSYEIQDTANDLYVEVTAVAPNANRLFEVMYKDGPDTSNAVWTSAIADKDGDNQGKYKIPKAKLSKDLVIKVVYMREITLDWQEDANWTSIAMSASATRANSKKNEGIWGDQYDKDKFANKLLVPKNTKVVLTVTPANNAKITIDKVTLQKGSETAAEQTVTNNKATFTIAENITDDYTVSITATGSYQKAVLKDGDSEVEAVSGKYNVAPRKAYTLSAQKAGGKAYAIGAVKVCEGSAEIKDNTILELKAKTKKETVEGEEKDVPDGTWELDLKENAQGKTLKVMLYANEEDTKEVGSITLSVAPAITKLTGIAKAKKVKEGEFTVSQIVGKEEVYTLTLDPKQKTSKDVLAARVKADDTSDLIKGTPIIELDAKGNRVLKITTNVKAIREGLKAQVEIINNSSAETEKPVIATLTVTATEPTWTTKAPGVKLASATDIQLKLAMTLPAGATLPAPEGTGYWYKVIIEAKDYDKDTESGNNVTGITPFSVTNEELPGGKKVEYVEATQGTTNANITVLGGSTEFGKGRNEKFNVTVSLVQYTKQAVDGQADEATKPDGAGDLIASSKVATLTNAATKEPYFADKITLKKTKVASGVFTGQKAVPVADIDFGKNTSYNRDGDVKAEVVGDTNEGDKKLTAEVVNGQVQLTVPAAAKTGKYTIRVTQTVAGDQGVGEGYGLPAETNPTSATLPVTVVQGIKKIEATSQEEIFVPANKAGTAKITVTYNDGDAKEKPKKAAVDYVLGTVGNDGTFTEATGDSPVLSWVTVKKGTVTVKKGYAEQANAPITDGKFAVQVKAADYKGNETDADVVEYTIKTTAQELGKIVLVQKEEAASSGGGTETLAEPTYEVVADETTRNFKIEEKDANKTYVRILPKGSDKTTGIAEADFVPKNAYTLTLSNKKDIKVNSDAALVVTKAVKNVTVKALTTDGGKKKAANDGKVKFSVTPNEVAFDTAKLQIKEGNTYIDFATDGYSANGNYAKQVYTVKAVAGTEDLSTKGLVDYQITAGTGVKIVKVHDDDKFTVDVVLTKAEGVVKLVGPKDAKGKAQTKEYKIKNDVFTKKTAAPKITLKKGEKIYAKYGEDSDTRKVTFTIAKGVVEDAEKIMIKAESDSASQALYEKLETKEIALGGSGITLNAKKPSDIELTFKGNIDVIKKATLYFDFVKEETSGEEGNTVTTQTSLTKAPASVSVKTELLKKTYKLQQKYTMSEKDLAAVALTNSGKMEGVSGVEFTKLLNANIKGKINKFTGTANGDTKDYAFELSADKKKLVLANPERAVNVKKGDNNLTGFVQYKVTYDDGDVQTYITQITVTMKTDKNGAKAVRTLKTDKVSMLNAANETVTLNVKAGKDPVALVYAKFEADSKSKAAFTLASDANALKAGKVMLNLTAAIDTPAVQNGKLIVVAADSYGALKLADTASDNDKAALAAQYGIEIKNVKIDVKKIDTANKVAINSKDAGLNFKETVASGEEGAKKYVNTVAYTHKVVATVSDVMIDSEKLGSDKKPITPNWITVKKVDNEDKVEITINQADYAAYVKEGKKINKGKTTYPLNGKKVSAALKFTYGAANSKPDTVVVSITPPTLDTAVIEGAGPVQKEITVAVTPKTTSVAKGGNTTFTAEVKVGGTKDESATVAWSVVAASDGGTLKDGGSTAIDADGKLTVDSGETATKLTITATYTDTADSNKTYTDTAEVTITDNQTPES